MALITLGTNSGKGKVLQVVTATDSTERTTTSSSFVTASNTLAVNITPSSSSNKIFVTCNFTYQTPSGTASFKMSLFKGSTNLGDSSNGFGNIFDGNSYYRGNATFQILDSPSTTSQVTYQLYLKVDGGTGKISPEGSISTITAYEIQG